MFVRTQPVACGARDVVSGLSMSQNRSVASACRGTPGLTSLLVGWEVVFVVGGGAPVNT